MELNWSTFLLEFINFLVLVWILVRFLFRPITTTLEARRQKMEQKLIDAKEHHTRALALEQQYEQQLNDWTLEKQQLKDDLLQELQTEKNQQLEKLKIELANERENILTSNQRNKTEKIKHFQQQAHLQGARFASQLLNSVANESLESSLFELLLIKLQELSDSQKNEVSRACKSSIKTITVTSTYILSNEKRKRLEKIIGKLFTQRIPVTYLIMPELIAGFLIEIGASVLRINIRDELSTFAKLATDEKP